jgi:class 3 adenylate cyclase
MIGLAALPIQNELAAFNRDHADRPTALELGLHAGPCVTVTTADALGYFGTTVNAASRLAHRCRGEILLSQAVLADAAARRAIAGRPVIEDEITLRGLAGPIRFCRIGARS